MSAVISITTALRAIRDSRSTKHADRAVLIALILRCRPKEGYKCWPSYDTLADDCQLDPATVKRAAKHLIQAKLVLIRHRRNKSNMFYVNVPKLVVDAETMQAQLKVLRDAQKMVDGDDQDPFSSVSGETAPEDQDNDASWITGGAQ